MMRRVLHAIAIGMFLVCTGATALAQSADALKKAQELFDKAQQDYLKGKFDDAAAGFLAAHDARAFPQFLYNVGACYHMKGKKTSDPAAYKKAVEYYSRYIKDDPKAPDKPKIENAIAVLEKEIKRLGDMPAPATPGAGETKPAAAASDEVQKLGDVNVRGLVVLDSEPSGAAIYLDDKKKGSLGVTPWSGSLEGEHKIIFEKRGFKMVETRLAADPTRLVAFKAGMAEDFHLGWLEVTSNVPGADVFIGDKSVGAVGKTPFSENYKPGKYTLYVSAEGYDEYTQDIEVVAGESLQIKAPLKGAPVGKLNITGPEIEEAAIYVDGKLLCERGPCLKGIHEGSHEVSIRRPGHKPYTKKILIQAKTETALRVTLAPMPSRVDAIVAYTLSAAFIGGGIYLGLQANNTRDELKRDIAAGMPPPSPNDSRFLRGKIFAIAADGLFAVAGISALTGVYYTFREKGRPSTGLIDVRSLALTPSVTPSYAGLDMEVRW